MFSGGLGSTVYLIRLRISCVAFFTHEYTNWVCYYCLILLLCFGSSFCGIRDQLIDAFLYWPRPSSDLYKSLFVWPFWTLPLFPRGPFV